MRFILLGFNVIVLVLLFAYLFNLMGINELGINTILALFLAAMASVLVVDHLVELKMTNPLMYLVPGVVAAIVPFIMVRQLSVVSLFGVLLTVPGIVLLVNKNISN